MPDDVQWTDPFSKLRLPEERSERTSFEIAELQALFNAPVFTEHQFPSRSTRRRWVLVAGACALHRRTAGRVGKPHRCQRADGR